MKTILCVKAVCSFLTAHSQARKTFEISGSFHSVDPIIPLGVIFFTDSRNSIEGDNINNSIALGLTGKYFFAENTALRLKLIHTNRDLQYHLNGGSLGTGSFENVKNTQYIYKFAPGVQWALVQKKFSFFSGLELPVSFIGKMTETTQIGEQKSGTLNTVNRTYEIPGGNSFGLGLFFGSIFTFSKTIGFGFEIASAWEKTIVGGNLTLHQTSSNAGEFNSTTNETVHQIKFAPIQASFNLSFRFK